MSGHSHWARIKHQKGAADAKKGKAFSKVARMIILAARTGGGDPDMNLKLKYALDKARAVNMPKESIERSVKKGTGELEGVVYEEFTYEGFGPGGVAMMLDMLTDNRNRTAAEIRRILDKRGGRLGDAGSVAYMFERKGLFLVDQSAVEEEKLIEISMEAGADNIESDGDAFAVTCTTEVFEAVQKALAARGIEPRSAEIARVPKSRVRLTSPEDARRLLNLVDDLEEHEDVQNVSANFDIPDEILDKIQKE
jgi:YebC/PmpR family DNA-binding regulatory protein